MSVPIRDLFRHGILLTLIAGRHSVPLTILTELGVAIRSSNATTKSSALFAGAKAVLVKIGVTGVDSNFATAIRTTVILLFMVSFSRFSSLSLFFAKH